MMIPAKRMKVTVSKEGHNSPVVQTVFIQLPTETNLP
jgi:hypothetical protein